MQARLRALHHVDVPWRPCDLEQREGRIIRQGNQNDEVDIVNYVTEGTYDTVMWQKVEAKTVFIEQARHNEVTDLEIEDLSGGDIGAAAAETKALATGDPRYLRQVQLQDDVKRLSALERAHHEAVRRRDFTVATLQRAVPKRQGDLETLAPVAARAAEHTASGSSPIITVADHAHAERATAAEPVAAACRQAFIAGKDRGASRFAPLGVSINGVEVLAARDLMHDMLLLRLAVPSRITEIKKDDLMATAADGAGTKSRGLLKRAENLYTDLPRHHEALRGELDRERAELDDLLANPPGGFEQIGELTDKQAELAAMTLELRLAAQSPEAKAKAAAAEQRMAERGREPGWSLLLNPTPRVLEELGYPNAEALRTDVRERERAAAARFAACEPEGTSLEVAGLSAEVQVLEAAGARSPAAMYRVPEQALSALDEPSRAAVIAIANSAHTVQPLHLHDGADKPAALAALAAAAHHHQHRILGLAATQRADTDTEIHRYADTTTSPAAARDHLQAGRWQLPIGSLVVVDDADQLPPDHLRWLTDTAAATNTKLVLITTCDHRAPAHTLTDALAADLPWAQHLGTPTPGRHRHTAAQRAAAYLATTTDTAGEHTHARQLLDRRQYLITRYRDLTRERTIDGHNRNRHRDGLEL